MAQITPVASYSLTVRVRFDNRPGMLGKVAAAIGDAGGDIGAVDIVEVGGRDDDARHHVQGVERAPRRPSSSGSRRSTV